MFFILVISFILTGSCFGDNHTQVPTNEILNKLNDEFAELQTKCENLEARGKKLIARVQELEDEQGKLQAEQADLNVSCAKIDAEQQDLIRRMERALANAPVEQKLAYLERLLQNKNTREKANATWMKNSKSTSTLSPS